MARSRLEHLGPCGVGPVDGMISVRRIRPGEAELFRTLRLASLKESPSAFSSTYESAVERTWENWREQADGTAAGTERCTMVAFSEGSAVGLMAVYRDQAEPEEAELHQVWVRPESRGGAAGSALLDAVLDWCGANGILRVLAQVTPGNDRALRFYTKRGFEVDPARPGDEEGEVVLVRTLSPLPGKGAT